MMEGCVATYIGQIGWCPTLKEILEDIDVSKRTWRSSADVLRTKHSKCEISDVKGCFGSCYVWGTPSSDRLDW